MAKTVTRGFLAALTAVAMFAGPSLTNAADNAGPGRAAASGPATQATVVLRGCFAVVNATGSIARARCAVSSAKNGTGLYAVRFNADIRRCSFQATLGLSTFTGASPSGEIAVVGLFGSTNGVFVQTFNSAGAPADRGFHLTVIC